MKGLAIAVMNVGLHKVCDNFCLAEVLLTYQEGLSFVALVISFLQAANVVKKFRSR